jgi:hypothetical protein
MEQRRAMQVPKKADAETKSDRKMTKIEPTPIGPDILAPRSLDPEVYPVWLRGIGFSAALPYIAEILAATLPERSLEPRFSRSQGRQSPPARAENQFADGPNFALTQIERVYPNAAETELAQLAEGR